MGRFWALWLLLWHLYVMGYPWSVTKYLDRDSRQACQLRFPSVNDNNSTTCTALAPPTRTHGLLYSMEDLGNSSPPRHLMTLSASTSSGSTSDFELWYYDPRQRGVDWVTSKFLFIKGACDFTTAFTLEDSICPSKSKRPKWIEINKTLMRSSKKNRKRKHTQKTKKHNVNVKSLANGECDRPAAVL